MNSLMKSRSSHKARILRHTKRLSACKEECIACSRSVRSHKKLQNYEVITMKLVLITLSYFKTYLKNLLVLANEQSYVSNLKYLILHKIILIEYLIDFNSRHASF